MKEEVYRTHMYPVGHRVDRQLLLSLKDIFTQYNKDPVLEIIIECTNGTTYTFGSIEECFEYFEKKPYRIIKMEIDTRLGENYDDNRVTIVFDNSKVALTEIKFRFNNGDDYLLLKNKIELCLKNFRLNYRILARIPIISVLLTLVFIIICVYTNAKNIRFPLIVQQLIIGIWLIGGLWGCLFSPFVRWKRNLFPCTEFRVGQNELIEKKNELIRNFIISTVVIGTVLGVIGNYISDFLF